MDSPPPDYTREFTSSRTCLVCVDGSESARAAFQVALFDLLRADRKGMHAIYPYLSDVLDIIATSSLRDIHEL